MAAEPGCPDLLGRTAMLVVAAASAALFGATPNTAPGATAGTPEPVEWVGQLGGVVTVMAIDGDRAYVAAGARLAVLDVSDIHPRLLGSTEPLSIHGPFHYLAVSDELVFGSVAGDWLQVIDVSSVFRPALLGVLSYGRSGGPIATIGHTLFLSEGDDVLSLDVADPLSPRLMSRTPVYGYCRQLLARDGRLYVVTGGRGLLILDVADPRAPRTVKWFEEIDVHLLAPFDELAFAVVTDEQGVPGQPGQTLATQSLRILDLSPEATSVDIGRLKLAGDAPAADDLQAVGRRAFVSQKSSVVVVDAADPAHPAELARFRLPWSNTSMGTAVPRRDTVTPGHIAVSGDRLYAAFNDYNPASDHANESGVAVFALADPDAIAEVGAWTQEGPANVDNLVAVGDLLYVAEVPTSRLRVYDIAQRLTPRLIATIEVDTGVRDFAVSGSRHVVLDEGASALLVLEMEDPESPRLLASREVWGATAVEIRGDLLYCALHGPGETGPEVGQLAVLRLTGDGELEEVVRLEGMPLTALDLSWANDLLVMTSQLEGLTFIDVSDVPWPRVVGAVGTPYRAQGATWMGEAAYVAVRLLPPEDERHLPVQPRYGGVMVVDAHDALNPIVLATSGLRLDDYRGSVDRWGIGVRSGLALLAAAEGKLRVFDVRDLSDMREVQELRLPGVLGALTVAGDYAYVAGQDAGLSIVRVHDMESGPRLHPAYMPVALARN